MLKIVSWNIGQRPAAWRSLVDSDADVALLQEACEPPPDIVSRFDVGIEPWRTEGSGLKRPWRAARFGLIGLHFAGPQFPNGRRADPWPKELPRESMNVPTFHTKRQTPATATRQLDFVFASNDIVPLVTTHAANLPDEWGPSDHLPTTDRCPSPERLTRRSSRQTRLPAFVQSAGACCGGFAAELRC